MKSCSILIIVRQAHNPSLWFALILLLCADFSKSRYLDCDFSTGCNEEIAQCFKQSRSRWAYMNFSRLSVWLHPTGCIHRISETEKLQKKHLSRSRSMNFPTRCVENSVWAKLRQIAHHARCLASWQPSRDLTRWMNRRACLLFKNSV